MAILTNAVGPVSPVSASGFDPGPAVTTAAAEGSLRRVIVVLHDDADTGKVVRDHQRRFGIQILFEYRYALRGYAAMVAEDALPALSLDPAVQFIENDRDDRPPGVATFAKEPTQPAQTLSFAIGRIGADVSSTASGDGRGNVNVNVAVLDGGVQRDHPDLNVDGGANCVGSLGRAIGDPSGHGTMVAGFIAARDNKIGRVGIAPGARIYDVRVLADDLYGFLSELVCGIDWVAGTRLDATTGNDIAIANMSLGGPIPPDDGTCGVTDHDSTHRAICGLVALGVTVVVSAGNEGYDFVETGPATYGEVLTVTAMADRDSRPGGLGGVFMCDPEQYDDTVAYWSNFATLASDRSHVVSAPGVCMASTFPGSAYGVGSGTSFSSPVAAGTVALCMAFGPCAGKTPAQVIERIVADAEAYNLANPGYGYEGDPLRPDGSRYYGYLLYAGQY
jgi:subtilisin family serine protease